MGVWVFVGEGSRGEIMSWVTGGEGWKAGRWARIPGQAFAELPFEEEILEFIGFLGHEATPKPKASSRRKRSGSNTSITPPTTTTTLTKIVAVIPKPTATAKGKQPAKAKSLSDASEVARTEAQQLKIVLKRSRQQTHIS
nr:hypothetical protein [Tanacetum cinerariifolium]